MTKHQQIYSKLAQCFIFLGLKDRIKDHPGNFLGWTMELGKFLGLGDGTREISWVG